MKRLNRLCPSRWCGDVDNHIWNGLTQRMVVSEARQLHGYWVWVPSGYGYRLAPCNLCTRVGQCHKLVHTHRYTHVT